MKDKSLLANRIRRLLPATSPKARYAKASAAALFLPTSADEVPSGIKVIRKFVQQTPVNAVETAGFLKLTCHEGRSREYPDARPPMNPESTRDLKAHIKRLGIDANSGFTQLYRVVDGWGGFLPHMSFDRINKLETQPRNLGLSGREQDSIRRFLPDVPGLVTILSGEDSPTKMLTSPEWPDGFVVVAGKETFWFPTYLDVLGAALHFWWNESQQFRHTTPLAHAVGSEGLGGFDGSMEVYDFRGWDPVNGGKIRIET